jgi:hypothetical protein
VVGRNERPRRNDHRRQDGERQSRSQARTVLPSLCVDPAGRHWEQRQIGRPSPVARKEPTPHPTSAPNVLA